MRRNFCEIFLLILVVLFLAVLITCLVFKAIDTCSMTEVETYTVGCEVSQMSYAEKAISRSATTPVYKMGVRNDDFAATFEVSTEDFARYVIGDIVEVKVTIYEHIDGRQTQEYQLVK
jgi:hypothetical protein